MLLQVDPVTGRARKDTEVSRSARQRAFCQPYRSKWELCFANYLLVLLEARKIAWWAYEPVTLKLAKGLRYTPDFLVEEFADPKDLLRTGPITFYEVKGWSRNRREGMAKLKMASSLFSWARFVLVEYRGGRMMLTPLTP